MKKQTKIKKLGSKRSKRGFTLLETVMGMGLFATALFGILMVLVESLAFGKYAQDRTIAIHEARRVVEDIRRIADTSGLASLVGASWTSSELPSETISVTDFSNQALQNNADPLSVRVNIGWNEKGRTNNYQVETLVTQR